MNGLFLLTRAGQVKSLLLALYSDAVRRQKLRREMALQFQEAGWVKTLKSKV
jgi:hypothetical protein